MKYTNKTVLGLSMAGALLIPQLVSAHSSIVEKEIIEGGRFYLTAQIPHGCGHESTKKIKIIMNSHSDPDPDWAFSRISPVMSWYDTVTGVDEDGREYVEISGFELPTDYVLNTRFRGKAPMLSNGEKAKVLNFDIIQDCGNGITSEWTVENGRAASVTVVKSSGNSIQNRLIEN
jgi:uncharacterized protein YcnI